MSGAIADSTTGLSTLVDDSPQSWLSTVQVLSTGQTTTIAAAVGVLQAFGAQVTVVDDGSIPVTGADQWDIVLVDRIHQPRGIGDGDLDAASYCRLVEQVNRGVWVTASTFGLDTDRSDVLGSDLVALAAGGVLGHSRVGDGTPTVPAGDIGLKLVGTMVAMAALHGLHLLRSGGEPVHLDVSAQAAVIASGLCLEMAHALGQCPDEGGSSRYGAPTGFFDCGQGQMYLVVLEQHQWEALRRTLHPVLDDLTSIEDGRRAHQRVIDAVRSWAATRSNLECERLLQDAGVPCTAVNSVSEYLERARQIGRPLQRQSAAANMPATVRTVPTSTTIGRRPLHELTVLDAGHVLAVPLATSWLGAMGARVTKLEDAARLDVYRRRGPFLAGTPGLNRSAYFNQVNFCKTPLEVTVTAAGSDLDLEPYDVVVHNVSPRRAVAVGVDGQTVCSLNRPRLSLTSSGFGATGQWARYRAYGHNIHAFSGLVSATRDQQGQMDDVGTPWADPLTGAVTALWVLAWSLAPEHNSVTAVDLSMAEVMASQLFELATVDPDRYYSASGAGQDLFLRVGADLIAVSLTTPAMAQAFHAVTAITVPDGLRRAGEIPTEHGAALGETDAHELVQRLTGRGVAAAVVETARSLAREDNFVHSTGLFGQVHSSALGSYEVTGLPWTIRGQEHAPLTSAPERP